MIKPKDILQEDNKSLRIKSQEVAFPVSDETKEVLQSMLLYVKNSQDPEISKKYGMRESVGIAAPQIGIPKRMFAIYAEDLNGKLHEYMIINPKIASHSMFKTFLPDGEGCLSVSRAVKGIVPRYKTFTLKANLLLADGTVTEEKTIRFDGIMSIIIQHEFDHLNGILFTDKIEPYLGQADLTPLY